METTKEFMKDLATIALLFAVFFLAMGAIGCGDGGTPVYDDQGNCIANCGDVDVLEPDGSSSDDLNGRDMNQPDNPEEDGFIQPDDSKDATQPTDTVRDCGSGPDAHCSDVVVDAVETDLGTYECLYDTNNTPPYPYDQDCLPEKAEEARCAWNEYTGETHCTGGYNPEQGYIERCTTDEECQWAPPDEYPPCVCWDACVFHLFYGGEVWYCTPTTELSSEEFFFSSIQILLSFKNQATTCGVETYTDHGSHFYTFIPDDQEKRNLLFSEGIKKWRIPSHFLEVDSDHITVHRTEGGNVIANCCPGKECE